MKSSELITVGYDFCSTLIAMINSKILKRKFTVDTSLNHLYQMNQKAFKKSLSMITSKDDTTTASLLGFAIINRVDSTGADQAIGSGPGKHKDDGAAGHSRKEDKDKGGKDTSNTAEKDGTKSRKNKADNVREKGSASAKAHGNSAAKESSKDVSG